MNVLMKLENNLKAWANQEQTRVDKAVQGAIYEATYDLYVNGRKALKAGNLGMPERQAYRNVSQIKKGSGGSFAGDVSWSGGTNVLSGAIAKIPLRSIAPGVLYKVYKADKRAEVGFIGIEGGAARIKQWAEDIASKHLTAYNITYDKALRDKLHAMGIHLKKSTTTASVPERSIMDHVNIIYGAMALEKLADSFERKMAGEYT